MSNVFKSLLASLAILTALCAPSQSRADLDESFDAFAANSGLLSEGSVYIHTYRNSPVVKRNGERLKLKAGDIVSAKNLSVKTDKWQCVTLVLSNATVIFAKGQAEFTIEQFDQIQPFKVSLSNDTEVSRSLLKLSVKSGTVFVTGEHPRPTSKTFVKMKFGEFEPQSNAYAISASANESRLDLLEGQCRFRTTDGKNDFFQQGQFALATAETIKGHYPLNTNPINAMENESMLERISTAKTASESVFFQFSSAGKLRAIRVIPKEFFLKKPKYDFRPF